MRIKVRKIADGVARSLRGGLKVRVKKDGGALRPEDLLSTGSTLLNLALSGRPDGGYLKGRYFFLVGDSASGKTWLSLTCFAEATLNPHFKDYALVQDNPEDGALMDVARYFGEEAARRVQPPRRGKGGEPAYSETIEDFYHNVDDWVKRGKPFIYVLDSMDSVTSADEQKKFEELKEATRKGAAAKGSYGDGKAKKNSAGLRRLLAGLRRTGSILIIIAQTRDNIDAFSFEKKTRSGGRALRFYATAEMWSSIVGTISKTVRGKKRKIGTDIMVQVKKNRLNGGLAAVKLAFFPSFGLDDVGSCVDFMVDEGFWPKKGKGRKKGEAAGIKAVDFGGVTLSRDALIKLCEGDVPRLQAAVARAWRALETECAVRRKGRYA